MKLNPFQFYVKVSPNFLIDLVEEFQALIFLFLFVFQLYMVLFLVKFYDLPPEALLFILISVVTSYFPSSVLANKFKERIEREISEVK